MAELNWSDAQWQKVNNCVTEAFGKASVASAFLPCYGPLAGSIETVRNERLNEDPKEATITLDGDYREVNLKLLNLTVKVKLSSEQVADETLSNALLAFRRAANILAQEEDRIVFKGAGSERKRAVMTNEEKILDPPKGLAKQGIRDFEIKPEVKAAAVKAGANATGVGVVSAVVSAIRRLEEESNPGPFACVLGNNLFEAVYQPSFAFVLPSDRITPLLKGPLLRSGELSDDTGIVISLAGNAIDIVVGTPPTVQFLQRTEDAKFLFRVYERFVLRTRGTTIRKVVGGEETLEEQSPIAGFKIT